MEKLTFKSYNDLIDDVKAGIPKLQAYQFDLVVGIPRSGMIPAYLISAFLNLDCTDLDSFVSNRRLQRGITRKTKKALEYPSEAKHVLIVDDSIYSGESLKLSLEKLNVDQRSKIKTLAIYYSQKKHDLLDIGFELLQGRKLFEWGLFHNNIISKTCFDLDGVICEDPKNEDNDDGPLYINHITNARPKFLPSGIALAIVTNRLEKYREQTEAWLHQHSVRYEELIMLNLPSKAERQSIDPGHVHKGAFYQKSPKAILFIESSHNQSITISRTSGKPVYCLDKNEFISPDYMSQLKRNPGAAFRAKLNILKHKLKVMLDRP